MARAEVTSMEDPQDLFQLDSETLDPSLHYRFCHSRNHAKRRAQGYELVLRSESGIKLLNEDERVKSTDDLIRIGNLFLMACQKEKFQQRRQKVDQISRDRLKSSEKGFEARAKKRGVRSLTGE